MRPSGGGLYWLSLYGDVPTAFPAVLDIVAAVVTLVGVPHTSSVIVAVRGFMGVVVLHNTGRLLVKLS